MPATALIATIIRAVANVSFRACQANGSTSSSRTRRGPGRWPGRRAQPAAGRPSPPGTTGVAPRRSRLVGPGSGRGISGSSLAVLRSVKIEAQTPLGSVDVGFLTFDQPPRSAMVNSRRQGGGRSPRASGRAAGSRTRPGSPALRRTVRKARNASATPRLPCRSTEVSTSAAGPSIRSVAAGRRRGLEPGIASLRRSSSFSYVTTASPVPRSKVARLCRPEVSMLTTFVWTSASRSRAAVEVAVSASLRASRPAP